MPSFKIDLSDGGDYQKNIDPRAGLVETATRVALVYGLADGADRASATALVRSQSVVETVYPLGLAYDPTRPRCTLRGYRNEGVAADSGAVRVRLLYSTPPPGQEQSGGGGQPWTVDTSSRTQRVTTQLDPQTKKVLWLVWTDPKNPKNRIQNIASMSFVLTIKRYAFTAVLPWAKVEALEGIYPGVNGAPWFGLPAGYWNVADFSASGVIGVPLARVAVVVESKVTEDWSEFELSHDAHTGLYYADRAAAAALAKKPYKYGIQPANGIIKNGPFPMHDFSAAFGVTSLAQVRGRGRPPPPGAVRV